MASVAPVGAVDTNTSVPNIRLAASPAQRKSNHPISPATSLLAGSIAGAVEATVTYPFEYAKTRVQLRGSSSQQLGNPLRLLQRTLAQDGFSAIYKGCGALCVGTALKAGVRFATFDAIKNLLADDQGRLSTSNGVFAGMLAGAVESVAAVTPTERIKTALIDDAKGAKRYRSTLHAAQTLLREQGARTFYRGLVSTTAKQSATSAVRMGLYNVLKMEYAARFGKAPQGVLETFSLGAVAGVGTVYATQPFDTVKTRAQSDRGEGLLIAIRGVWQTDGARGFWKGSTMRLGRLVMSGGIVFSVYEQIVALLR